MGACRCVAHKPCRGPQPRVVCAFRAATLEACSHLMWGGSVAFYAGMEVVTKVGFPSSRHEGHLRRALMHAQHVKDIL